MTTNTLSLDVSGPVGARQAVVAPGPAARAAVLAAAGLTIMAPALIAPSLPAMAGHFGDETQVRLALTITSLAIAVGAPLAGVLADRVGRRPVLLAGLAVYAAAAPRPLTCHRNPAQTETRTDKETTMIVHGNRFTIKTGVTPEQLEEALESLRNQGRVIPSVKSFVVGRDYGGEYEWGATFVIDDLDGYWEYLIHPAHMNTDRVGLPLVDKFASFDITDDDDPEMGAKIAALHQRRYESDATLTQLVSGLGEYTGSAAPGPHGDR